MDKLFELKNNIELAIKGVWEPIEFIHWFENWHVNNTLSLNNETLNILQKLYTDVGFYEPDEELRQEHFVYFDDEEIIEKFKEVQNKLFMKESK